MDETAKRIEEQVSQVQEVYEDQRRRLADFAKTASEKSRQAFTFTDQWLRDNPWLALGVIMGAGLLIGLLVGRSSSNKD